MLHDNKSNDVKLAADPLPTSTWVRVASLLGLPPEARPGFERLWFAYRWNKTHERETRLWLLASRFLVLSAFTNFGYVEINDPPDLVLCEQLDREHIDWLRRVWQVCETRLEQGRKEPPQSRLLVLQLRDMTAHFTGNRPNHGEKWLGALTAVCQEIDPAITKWQVEDALHPRKRRRRSN
jgi:hypothetical protein